MQIYASPMVSSALGAPQPLDTGNSTDGSSNDSGTSEATITANDFLQLLVTEMKNQDPTANTDPNEYIDQLVQVNSLQQLISINNVLSGLGTTSSASPAPGDVTAPIGSSQKTAGTTAAGNLSATDTDGSAARVASALETAPPSTPVSASNGSVANAVSTFAQAARTRFSNPTH